MTDLLLLQLVKDRAATAMRAVVNLLYGIAQMFYFVFQFPDFMSQGISYIFPELVDIHLGEIHVFLPVVGTKALDLLPVAASVEEPAATGDESEQGGNEVPKVVHDGVCLQVVIFEPLTDIEAWAGFVGVLVVAVVFGDGILFHQVTDKLEQDNPLGFGAGVGRTAVVVEAADIGDADAAGVVSGAVGARLLDGAAGVDAAVGVDDIMIADVVPAEAAMVSSYALHGTFGIGAGGGAMEDDFGDGSHFFMGLVGLMGFMGGVGVLRRLKPPEPDEAFLWSCNDIVAYAKIEGIETIDWIERGLGWILAPALSGLVRV
jgi:hypothetical protein